MYSVDELDVVKELTELPQSSVGAPCPMILCSEYSLHLAYYLQKDMSDWDGRMPRMVGITSKDEDCALVKFTGVISHMFGLPNDEAFAGHPLSSRGLAPYTVFEVEHSSWLRTLERMNSVHPAHRPERYMNRRHLIFAFHDSTFECIAKEYELSVHKGSVLKVLLDSPPEILTPVPIKCAKGEPDRVRPLCVQPIGRAISLCYSFTVPVGFEVPALGAALVAGAGWVEP